MRNDMTTVDLNSLRAHKARLAHRIGVMGYRLLLIGAASFVAIGSILFLGNAHQAYAAGGLALLCYMLAVWYNRDLAALPPTGPSLQDHLSGEVFARLKTSQSLSPQHVWHALSQNWQVAFLLNHFAMSGTWVENLLSSDEAAMPPIWVKAQELAQASKSELIEPGFVAAALMLTSPQVVQLFTQSKLGAADIKELTAWLGRILESMRREKPYFGGVGRDWTNGFTPQLSHFGQNISLGIEQRGLHFGWLTTSPGVQAMENAFSQGATAIALVGDSGVGKTSHVYALAQVLLQSNRDRKLAYNQIIALNSSLIISSARHPGELEQIVLGLLQESVHAGHIVLFFDDAQLFFGSGPGAFDVSQILLPIVQNHSVRVIFAMTPNDYQGLKAKNSAFAGQLSPVILSEPPESAVMRVLEDTALGMEYQQDLVVTYDALREAYRLSGRYDQETAYPGKAIRLLEQALPHANQHFVTANSVQQAVEQTRGVKVGSAAPAEADKLLHLEDEIHQRMINQTRAVSVVASALRRARAGVANPKRPIGSFLFLGPTGVGKTELAKAIAATYFGAESNMVRLDMSEYQQSDDVKRLLSNGAGETSSLILAVRQQPFTVVLLDEIEKAHPNILNLLLQLLDEGELTDENGRAASFKDCIIIATSNAGAQAIRDHIAKGEKLEAFEGQFTDELISSGQFKPELLNRFDEIVLFRPLEPSELAQVVQLMLDDVNKTLANQNISVELTEAAVEKIVTGGYDARLGARPMRRMLQRSVEDGIAARILRGDTKPGDHVVMDVQDLAA